MPDCTKTAEEPKLGLFRSFGAIMERARGYRRRIWQDAGAQEVEPARPYICRLIILRRLIWPSTWPVLQGDSTAAAPPERSFLIRKQNGRRGRTHSAWPVTSGGFLQSLRRSGRYGIRVPFDGTQ